MYGRILLISLTLALVPGLALAQTVNPLGELISQTYTFAQSIIGLCIFAMFVYAGLQMMLGKRDKAISIIQDAVIGAVLLFSAYLILNTINHDLVSQPETTGLPQR